MESLAATSVKPLSPFEPVTSNSDAPVLSNNFQFSASQVRPVVQKRFCRIDGVKATGSDGGRETLKVPSHRARCRSEHQEGFCGIAAPSCDDGFLFLCTENIFVVGFFNLHHSLGKGSCRERSGSAPAVLNTSQQNVERRLLVLSVCSNTPFTKL